MTTSRAAIWKEVLVACAIAIGLISLFYHVRGLLPFISQYLALITAGIVLYLPIIIYSRRKEPFPFVDRTAVDIVRSLSAFALLTVMIFPPLLVGNHFYQAWFWDLHFKTVPPASDLISFFMSQLVFVALPEEFFFRGYIQDRLNLVYSKKWRLLGTACGPAWVLTALIFAVSHSAITVRWWHIFIFFPGLAFGWLKEKTGTILAPTLFHALSNVFAYAVFRTYG